MEDVGKPYVWDEVTTSSAKLYDDRQRAAVALEGDVERLTA